MVKRKLDGRVDESSVDRKIRKSDATVARRSVPFRSVPFRITCEKFGDLHLAKPGFMAVW